MPILLPTTTRTVALIAYPQVEALDISGPSAVFAGANRVIAAHGSTLPAPYRIEMVAPTLEPIATSDGLQLLPAHRFSTARFAVDTLLVAGSPEIERCATDRTLIRGVLALSRRARRIGSVCTGSFILAAAGLLDGRRATTHWAFAERLALAYPSITVEPDSIYVRDGKVYSSAGVSAGMDLALALVEEDLGQVIALEVARALVLYLRRPGGQTQFSSLLAAQHNARDTFADLRLWIAEHVRQDLAVPTLAARMAMSPRNFARLFLRESGVTPARFVERMRVEAARLQLEASNAGIKQVANACGFKSIEGLRQAFLRHLRIGPAAYRERFRATA